jgi:hypothetical protein
MFCSFSFKIVSYLLPGIEGSIYLIKSLIEYLMFMASNVEV